ncbi:MAG: hypothetical protein H5T33_04895 [Candidatus Methanosuratus sp.]|nr:hypothetical protein [Candidatus Methanosuratincola sp.]
MAISISVLTYTLIFSETFAAGQTLWLLLLITALLTITTSLALEYDTKDELDVLVYLGVSPSDIFKLGILRVLTLSLIGYFIGLAFALIIPIGQVLNVKVFYTFLLSILFGVVPPLYSAFKSLNVSLLGRRAFRPLSETEIPSIISPSEIYELKEFMDDVLNDHSELVVVSTSASVDEEAELLLVCRYLGVAGRESAAFIASTGLDPVKVFREDETLPLVTARLRFREGKCPSLNCWERKRDKNVENTFVALSFGTLIKQLVIEYKVYKGRRRADKLD